MNSVLNRPPLVVSWENSQAHDEAQVTAQVLTDAESVMKSADYEHARMKDVTQNALDRMVQLAR